MYVYQKSLIFFHSILLIMHCFECINETLFKMKSKLFKVACFYYHWKSSNKILISCFCNWKILLFYLQQWPQFPFQLLPLTPQPLGTKYRANCNSVLLCSVHWTSIKIFKYQYVVQQLSWEAFIIESGLCYNIQGIKCNIFTHVYDPIFSNESPEVWCCQVPDQETWLHNILNMP